MSNPFVYSDIPGRKRLLESTSSSTAATTFGIEQYIHSAFRLAYFIYPDKAIATSITIQALDNLEWAYSAQSRRLYYSPTGYCLAEQSRSQALRTKVLMSKPHLLQHLIYSESDPYEREQERDTTRLTLSQEDMVIRFIKHLVRITARRNSFYVTLGLSRLLYGYGTPETMSIYNVVVQNPQRVKEDAYYRLRKKQLLEEVKERFGDAISTVRGPRGEEVFEAEANSVKYASLVKSSLAMFTPWETSCVIPEIFDPHKDELLELRFEGRDPDREHPVEINRIHSVIDPGCFARLARALKMAAPEDRLRVPHLRLNQLDDRNNRPGLGRYNPPSLSREDVEAILKELSEMSERRKRLKSRSLSIRVDGEVVAILDTRQETRIRFHVGRDAELIKVIGEDEQGELTIAGHLLNQGEYKNKLERRIEVESGQKIILRVNVQRDVYGEFDGADIEAEYEASSIVMAATVYLKNLKNSFAPEQKPEKEEKYPPIWNLCRQFAFGKLDAYLPDQNEENRFVTSYSSAQINHYLAGSAMSLRTLYRMLISLTDQERVHQQIILANLLISFAETATGFKDWEVRGKMGEMLMTLSLPEARQIGAYYQALTRYQRGEKDQSYVDVEKLIDNVPPVYSARIVQTLGRLHHEKGNFDEAIKMHIEAHRSALNESKYNLQAALIAELQLSCILSDLGYNKASLSKLENAWPLVKLVSKQNSYYFYMYHNELAVELVALGRLNEALAASKIALASPYAQFYKEWHETGEEILQKTL